MPQSDRSPSGAIEPLIAALDKIAAPRRPDGTYNLSREACEEIAVDALIAWEDGATQTHFSRVARQRAERLLSFAREMRDLASMKTPDEWALQHWNRTVRGKIKGFAGDAEIVARDLLETLQTDRYQDADSPHNKERPRDVGAPGAAT